MKYKVVGEYKGAILAKTNVPMNQSGEAIKKLVDDFGIKLTGKRRIKCFICEQTFWNNQSHSHSFKSK